MRLSTIGEIELLEKLKQQDRAAFSQLYNLYVKKIYAYALGILKSPVLAEDVTQDTFVKLWEHAASVRTDRSVQGFLFTIARNLALNILKQASRETWISDELFGHALDQSEDGLQYTERRQTGEFIGKAIAQLPPQRRLIYDLCRNYGYSYKQAAEKLGIKDSTVNSQMVKALKTIKDFMVRNGALLLLLFYRS
ncbi:RNA polymerase sigma factor [Pedobacter heparinus]|uniref:RNA polymerase sigma-70 factor n=1 Tax=Pedobacter heparinus (strain ATCC 13125 / DSM 2366 / CIP 104194 / JCM 7457 / NBRC 12017 / NCIMB 9290 / NRRL B-14731 / HIM 762-3) TaxID=485917 RepID=C6XVX9_PEDHD|nr:RNA polymerase sigma-70 factor [Pedobacter heparinus]ACU06204.1 RNA polymerase sigma-70 factor [Pedobacter heparinus DSM 2366]